MITNNFRNAYIRLIEMLTAGVANCSHKCHRNAYTEIIESFYKRQCIITNMLTEELSKYLQQSFRNDYKRFIEMLK